MDIQGVKKKYIFTTCISTKNIEEHYIVLIKV